MKKIATITLFNTESEHVQNFFKEHFHGNEITVAGLHDHNKEKYGFDIIDGEELVALYNKNKDIMELQNLYKVIDDSKFFEFCLKYPNLLKKVEEEAE